MLTYILDFGSKTKLLDLLEHLQQNLIAMLH